MHSHEGPEWLAEAGNDWSAPSNIGAISANEEEKESLHPSALALLHQIGAQPGVHKSKLCRQTGLGWGNVGYHLRRLLECGLIVEQEIQGKACFATTHYAARVGYRKALILPNLRRILKLCRERGLIRPFQIARELGLDQRHIRQCLDLLQEEGIIQGDGSYHPVYTMQPFSPSDPMLRHLQVALSAESIAGAFVTSNGSPVDEPASPIKV